METKYTNFLTDIKRSIDSSRIYTDALRTLAWGTDAGFYRMIPKIVIRAVNEAEITNILRAAQLHNLPVTFRAAGTSLSGQSISDSILVVAGKHWEKYTLAPDAMSITLQPGIIGSRVNEILKPYGRIFSPDPASKNSAMVGGIVINNASGMNCGTHANSDRELLSARIVLADGTVLDTGDTESRDEFKKTHPEFISRIEQLRNSICANTALCERIKYKYSIKNVTGLNILPFVRFTDPFDIIAHLMVGSEGTLAFLSEVTVRTEHLYPLSASAMLYFDNIREACNAVLKLKKGPVYSAEMLDKKSLASVNDTTGEGLTALLVETKADTAEELTANINTIKAILSSFKLFTEPHFTDKPEEYSKYWAMRSGIFPSVGGTRPLGTTVLIEDVAFHIDDLPDATADLQDLLEKNGYDDACIYGHVLEGNYHFIISQSFDTQQEVARYRKLMEEVEHLVVDKYDGSLKAEHGTGRNMAPFVELEWGTEAFNIMKEVKRLFDPSNILNPGVIFNNDPECFIKNLKPLPIAHPIIDKCIECGFCEVNCVSCGLTLSSRQRIVLAREMARLKSSGEQPERLAELQKEFRYLGNSTCAGDGLCSTSCPMKINTGELIHVFREESLPEGSFGYKIGDSAARNLSTVKSALRTVLSVASTAQSVLGDKGTDTVGKAMHHLGLPLWTHAMPRAYRHHTIDTATNTERRVVYFPSCINQTMGAAHSPRSQSPLIDTVVQLLKKAGYTVIFPDGMDNLCCGLTWESKGLPKIADTKSAELEKALLKASENGRIPVICDQSPCMYRMKNLFKEVKPLELLEFIHDNVIQYLDINTTHEPIAVHITCSSRKMGITDKILALARLCSDKVTVPEGIGCCGFAGDKGFTRPELNSWGLRKLRSQITETGIQRGFSNSRTCEIGLTTNSGVPYQSLVYLLNECSTTKQNSK